MRLSHFHALKPVCPACRLSGTTVPLVLDGAEDVQNEVVRSGLLGCEGCGVRYPILDGLPVLVAELNRYLSDNLFYLAMRRDLPRGVASVLADATGPGAGLDAVRQHVSSYGWDHWADFDPDEQRGGLTDPGQAMRLLHLALEGLPNPFGPGCLLDAGCGAGRTALELAKQTDRLVLGIDLSVPLARVAQAAVVEGRVAYDRRRGGIDFEHRAFDVVPDERVDIWIADAAALPFEADSFALITALNLLDCVSDPRALLAEFGRVAQKGAACVLATPFDWSTAATPYANWLGGKSKPAGEGITSEADLDRLLSDGPEAAGSLRRSRAPAEAEWRVRLHDRSVLSYTSHLSWSIKAAPARFAA